MNIIIFVDIKTGYRYKLKTKLEGIEINKAITKYLKHEDWTYIINDNSVIELEL